MRFVFIVAIISQVVSLSSQSLSFSPQTISSVATYSIQFTIDSSIPGNSVVKITFPSNVQITDSSSVPCTVNSQIYNPTSSGVSCSVSNLVFTVTGVFGTAADLVDPSQIPVTIHLPSIKNPSSTQTTASISIYIYSTPTNIVDYSTGNTNLAITASPAYFSATSLTPSSTVIGSMCAWTFMVSTSFSIPVSSTIQVSFPYWNQYIGASSTDLLNYIRVSTPSASAISNMTSPLSTTFSSSTRTLTITGGFISVSTGVLQWSVSSIYNPPTADTVSGFSITIYDINGSPYLTTQNQLSVQVSTPNTVSVKSTAFSATNNTVSTSTAGFITFQLTNPTYASVVLVIAFPPEIVISLTATITGVSSIATSGLSSSILSNTITITNGWSSYFYKPTTSVSLKVDPITTPSSTSPTGVFTITTKSPGGNIIDTGTGGSFVTKSGIIYQTSSPLVTALDLTVGSTTTYIFDMWLSHPVQAGGSIIINFPAEVSVTDRPSTTPCTSIVVGVGSSATCQVTSKVLTVIGGFASNFGGGRVSFGINGVTNPASTATTSTFSYYSATNSSGTYYIDTKTSGITFTAAPSALVSVQVSPTSFITGDITTYTFTIVTKSTIPTNGYLLVTFPSGISFSSTSSASSSCSGTSGFTSSLVCSISGQIMTVNGFTSGQFLPGTLVMTIGFIVNAFSMAPSSSFIVSSYDPSGNVIDTKTTGIILTLTTPNIFPAVTVTPSSLVNGNTCTYTVSITLKNSTPSGSYIVFQAPSSVVLPSTPNCAAVSGITSASCSFQSSNSIQVTISSSVSLASGSVVSFSVDSVRNPGSTKPTDSFLVNSYTASGYGIDQKVTGITVTMTTAATIQTITFSAGDSKISSSTNYLISYLPVNTHPAGTVLFITIPSEFTLGTVTCSSASASISSSLSCLVSGRSVSVTSGFTSSVTAANTVSLKLSGFTNPTSQITTSPWQVKSVTSDNFLIDQSTTSKSSFTCDTVCQNCTTLPSTCTSCSPTSGYPYLYSSTCNAACLPGYTDDTSTVAKDCVACSSLCQTCSGSISSCTSCSASSGYPYLYSNTCNAGCLSGYWGNGTACIACTNPCKTCSSGSFCISCAVSTATNLQTYLLSSSCYNPCPNGYTSNSTDNTCVPCTGLCSTCSTSPSTCTSCVSPYKLQGTICVSKCITDGTYIETSTACNRCISPCYTCVNDTTTCTTCVNTYYLYQYSCTQTCPPSWTNILSFCRQCTSPCDQCSGSQTTCTSCVSGYYLQISSCVTSCSPGFYLNGYQCSPCSSVCNTCSGGASSCTSCNTPNYLLATSCVTSCPSASYVPTTGLCQPCQAPCATCSGQVTNCLSCSAGMYTSLGTCVSQCPADISVLVNGACQPCNSNCLKCAGTVNTCTSCPNNYYIQNGVCVDSCSFGFILLNSQCVQCNSACFTCSITTSNCTSCAAGQYLYSNTCVGTCPQGFVISGPICAKINNTGDCNSGCTSSLLNNNNCDNVCNVYACAYDNGYCNVTDISCGPGKYLSSTTCYPCAYPCSNCLSTSTTCTSCQASQSTNLQQYLYNNTCYSQCPTKTYQNGIVCTDCDIRCATCALSSSTCTSCIDPYKIYNNQCVLNCPGGTSVQIDSKTCADCSSNCLFCSITFSNCTACSSKLVLQGNSCVSYCNSGFFNNSGICQACVGCNQCSGTATNCTSCLNGLLVYQGSCVSSCPIGTYAGTNSCYQCGSACLSCSQGSSCDTCKTGNYLYLTACVSSCPTGYSPSSGICVLNTAASLCAPGCTQDLLINSVCDTLCNFPNCNYDNLYCGTYGSCGSGKYSSSGTCSQCVYPCGECISDTSCRSCQKSVATGNLLLLNGTSCVEQGNCNNGFTQIGVYCIQCDSSCATCSGSVTTCISCPSGKYLYNSTCVTSCPVLYSVTLGTVCMACASSCATCSGAYDKCSSCPNGNLLQGSSCVSACIAGYTVTSSFPTTCQACTGNCATCSGQTYSCTSCLSGLYLSGTSCVTTCPDLITISSGSTCLPCSSPCMNCQNSITQCTVCISGYSLYQSTCVQNCPSGYESRLGICTAYCAQGCTQQLLFNTACDVYCNIAACNSDNGMCISNSTCPVGQYLNGTTCTNCKSPCNTCSSLSVCTSCVVNSAGAQLYLFNGGCYLTCPSNSYLNGIQCVACDSSCATCSGSSTTCTSCPAGIVLYKGVCQMSCPVATTVLVNGTCLNCDNNCLECSGSITTCSKCLSGAVLSAGRCVPECPNGFTTTSTSNGACLACNGCQKCLGSVTYCTSCANGMLLYDNLCYSTCPSGFTNTSTYPTVCTACSSSCVECSGRIDFCTLCPAGKSLNSYNQCQVAATCPAGQTTTPQALTICQQCASPCLTCQNAINFCTSCPDGYYAYNGVCSSCSSSCVTCMGSNISCTSCPGGSYLSSKSCLPCLVTCGTCRDSASSCTSCVNGLYLSGTSCLECSSNCGNCLGISNNCTSCKAGFYLNGNSCLACNSNCYTCDVVPNNCTSCISGQYVNANRICTQCSSTCKDCIGSSTLCTSCNSGLMLVGDKCGVCNSTCSLCVVDFNTCGGCKNNLTLINGICGNCTNNCLTCSGSFSSCATCPNGYYLSNSQCLSCNLNCKTCVGTSTNCTSCYNGTSLISNSCQVCNSPCLTCTGSKSSCSSCSDGQYLSGSSCFSCASTCTQCFSTPNTCLNCQAGYYLSGNNCTQCSNLCVTCKTTSTYCTSCISGATLSNGVCLINCQSGYMQVGLSCEPCSPACKSCSGSVDKCTSCTSGIVYNNVCVNSCPTGFFVINGGCQPCATVCKECFTNSTICISCNTGYQLIGNSCKYVCSPGNYSQGGVCLPCDSSCNTCIGSSINCTSCSNSTYVILSDGTCVPPCPSGSTRLVGSNKCQNCSSECGDCSGSLTSCISCSNSNYFLYNGSCSPSCPQNVTVPIGNKCVNCDTKCVNCNGSPYTCTLCPNGTYLYLTTCVDSCPTGYQIYLNETCKKCYNPNNCSEIAPNISNSSSLNTTNNTSHPFQAKPVPFPFSGISIISAGIIAITKVTASGVSFVPSTISVWGAASCTSWLFLAAYIPEQGVKGSYRRLTEISAVGGNALLTVAFFLVVGGLAFHICCNLLFSITYSLKVLKRDKSYSYWIKSHKKINWVALVLSYVVSFHCIRLLFCGLCNYDGFKVNYENKTKVYKPLIKYGYISILCTFVPIFIAEVLILTSIDNWYWLWMFTLDSLFLTFFLALLILIDIKRREQEIMRYELEKQLGPLPIEGEELMKSHSLKDLIDMFPQLDFTSLVPLEPGGKRLLKKGISISRSRSPESSPRPLKRCASFPLLKGDEVEIKPEAFYPEVQKEEKAEEPFGEEILEKNSDIFDKIEEKDELTMIIEEVPEVLIPEEPKEFEISFTESKKSVSRPLTLNYVPIEIEQNVQEYTEIVAYTEEDEPSEENIVPIPEDSKEAEVEEFEIEHLAEPPKMSTENLLKMLSSESEKSIDSKELGTVNEEQEIDLEKAVPDPTDPEIVKVFKKETGERITIRKGFKGARIVNLENKVIDNLPPIDPKKFEVNKTIVDDNDVRFATMTAKNGEKVRVKRSFKGARILDLEKKVSNPNAYLIGQSVKNESDFQFSNAYPDPDDPEIVVVMHNETGEDVKIRKTFQGAQMVDEAGEPIPNAPAIDRNDYDIPKTIVDKDDVHLATLKNKFTNQKVKVRRTFRGAKIIDLERKAEFPKVLPTLSEKSDEPEPLSPSLSGDDLSNEMGWITPAEFQKISSKPVKKPPLKPIAVTPKVDETYDRRKLANLANLIDDLEDEPKDWQQAEPYRFISESSDDEKSVRPQKKTLYHNVDLDSVYAPDFRENFDDDFSVEKKKPKKKKKKLKKISNVDPTRMKGLEDIYLQRLEGKKKYTGGNPLKYTGEPGGFEPEWERTDSVHDFRFTGTLPSAGEEIINPRFKVSTPKRGF